MNDPAETLVTESLESHAASAPSDATLLGTVHRRLRRRRRARSAGVAVLACAAVAVAGVGIRSLIHPTDPGPTASIAQPPPGWHWESYANVEIQVPDSWQEIGAGGRATCPAEKLPWDGWVGRPSLLPETSSGCPVPVAGKPAVLEPAYRVPYVLFAYDAKPGVTQYEDGWTKEVRSFGPVSVEVFGADKAVRTRLLDSARLIDGADSNGCAPTHAAAADARTQLTYRPSGAGLASVGTTESIRICAYRSVVPSSPPLVASAELTGDQARDTGAALKAAPTEKALATTRSEPADKPGLQPACRIGDEEFFVLKVHGDRGDQEVVVRLTGCGPFETDDGKAYRALTKAAIGPVVSAVGRPEYRNPFLTQLLK